MFVKTNNQFFMTKLPSCKIEGMKEVGNHENESLSCRFGKKI